LNALVSNPGGLDNWSGPYLEKAPEDPWGEPYKYENPGRRGKEIDIYTLGVDNQEGGEGSNADWGNWNIK
jgi:general secretion pathway protein G